MYAKMKVTLGVGGKRAMRAWCVGRANKLATTGPKKPALVHTFLYKFSFGKGQRYSQLPVP